MFVSAITEKPPFLTAFCFESHHAVSSLEEVEAEGDCVAKKKEEQWSLKSGGMTSEPGHQLFAGPGEKSEVGSLYTAG